MTDTDRVAKQSAVVLTVIGGSLLVALLMAYGWSLAPSDVPLAPALVLAGYIAIARIGSDSRMNTAAARTTLICGSLAGIVLAAALAVEYGGRTFDNGLTFGTAAALCLVAALTTAMLTGRFGAAVAAGVFSAQIASLLNIAFILTAYYVLRGSALQDRFFRTEGIYDDFVRNGSGDFSSFVIADLFGGAFFHLVLGVCAGALVGATAAVLMSTGTRLFARRSS